MIAAIVDELAPALVTRRFYRSRVRRAAPPHRRRQLRAPAHSEASFAALCGVSPVPASSGKTTRHRLNRGGDGAANSALRIAIGRLRTDPRTKKTISQSVSPRAIPSSRPFRCLKRYIAREIFSLINQRRQEINRAQIAT